MSLYRHVPHPHLRARKETGAPTVAAERGHNLAERAGVAITDAVGTMACAAVFAVIALIGLPQAIQQSTAGGHFTPLPLVQWLAQTFLQLVLLSIIIVGQNASARAADKRAELTYLDGEAGLHMHGETHQHLAEQDAKILEIHAAIVRPRIVARSANSPPP